MSDYDLMSLEEQRVALEQWDEQLKDVTDQFREEPDNQDLVGIIEFIQAEKKTIKKAIAKNEAAADAANEEKPKKAPTVKKADEATPEPAAAGIKYVVNDDIMAKWVSGDKAFYPARITSVTGSSNDPVYTVKFKGYDTVETLRSKDIRPVNGGSNNSAAATTNPSTKRKADPIEDIDPYSGSASPANDFSPIVGSSNKGVVVQKPAEKYPDAEPAEKDGEKKKRAKKIKTSKELEKTKKNWLDFTKSKHGKTKKESQFRVPEGVNGRVGFVGSGQTMREDAKRSRHVYQPVEDDN